jgi:hypothetical protein
MAPGWIAMLLFCLLVIAVAVVAVRWMNIRGGAVEAPETALQILRRR